MSHPLLARKHHHTRPALPVLGDMTLAMGRAHEICGPARQALALRVIAAALGERRDKAAVAIWIAPDWQAERLQSDGLRDWLDPGRLLFVHPRRAEDLLWSMEEVLRAGVVPVVVAELPGPPGLTPVRRLHLAAETGAAAPAADRVAPIGLLLTPGDGGAAGVESRWHMAARHGADGSRAWRLKRRRARTAPPATWRIAAEAPQDGAERLRLAVQPAPAAAKAM